MYRVIQTVLFGFLVLALGCKDVSAAWPWSDNKNLLTINGVEYSGDDYKQWWNLWNENKNNRPESPQDFVEWKLLSQEARSMELDELPAFKDKMETYLKVRSRIYLKHEEVDSRIEKITEEDLKEIYNKDYSPIWLVLSLYFETLEKATAAYRGLSDKTVLLEDLLKPENLELKPHKWHQNIIRPYNFNRGTFQAAASVKKLAVGELSEPQPFNNLYVVFLLKDYIEHDPHDFEKQRKNIKEELFKEKQARLTYELLEKLKKKYNVKVDEELLAMATVDSRGEILKRPLVTTSKGDIPLYLLIKDLRKEQKVIKNMDDAAIEARKQGFLNGMIAEYLISWESADRHYEDKSPLKESYAFYAENRLIKELENVMLRKHILVSADDIANYYKLHPEKYSGKGSVSIAMLQDKQDTIQKIWDEINDGQDFFIVSKRYYTDVVPIKDVAVEKLSQAMAHIVENLAIGEVSSPFQHGRDLAIIKLINRHTAAPMPLEKVSESIKKELYQEKFLESRQNYIDRLLEQSQIDINERSWKKLQDELSSQVN